jgi:hypothetical protein
MMKTGDVLMAILLVVVGHIATAGVLYLTWELVLCPRTILPSVSFFDAVLVYVSVIIVIALVVQFVKMLAISIYNAKSDSAIVQIEDMLDDLQSGGSSGYFSAN